MIQVVVAATDHSSHTDWRCLRATDSLRLPFKGMAVIQSSNDTESVVGWRNT